MKSRGAVTLVFDDGYREVYNLVLPLLARYGVHAVFAVPLNPIDGKISGHAVASVQDWQKAAKKGGHELAAHGISHTSLVSLSPTELAKELQEPQKFLSATTIIYPGGAHNDEVVSLANNYYTAGRTVLYGLETLPPKDPMRLHTINFTKRNFSVVRANIHALRAFLQNKWLIETYHFVSDRPSSLMHSTLLSDLEDHVQFIASLPIRIGTIKEIL